MRDEERPLGAWATGEERLILEPEDNFFAFDFAALDYINPSQNRYRYRLDPLDRDWIEGGSQRLANYTSVPPDDYTFIVSAANSEGTWNEQGLRIPITVRPPFWVTWWFRVLVVGSIAGTAALAVNYRTRQLLRVERMRVQIAGELHDDVGANLSTIALRAQMAGSAAEVGDRTRQQLQSVGALARQTAHALREMVWVVNTEYDTVGHLLTRLQDTASLLLAGAVPFSFSVEGDVPDCALGMELRQSIFLLFKEALQNIVKHSGATNVSIVVEYERPELRLTVTDDGKGFDPFDPADTDVGYGLWLMSKRASRHKALWSIESQPGKGTVVGFTVRIG